MPCVCLPFRTTRWSMAGGGLIGNLSRHCPASALPPEKDRSVNIPPMYLSLKTAVRRTVAATFLFASHSSSACWAELTLAGQPPQVRLPALKAPPVKHRWYTVVRNEHRSSNGVRTSVVLTWEAGHKPG